MGKKIICIFCGHKADIVAHGGSDIVICNHCGRETDFVEYRRMLDKWLDEINRKA